VTLAAAWVGAALAAAWVGAALAEGEGAEMAAELTAVAGGLMEMVAVVTVVAV
jgi:hypothetical protein